MSGVFQRLSVREDVHVVMVVLLVLLAVSGIAAHWLTRIPGPLSESERIAVRASRVRRMLTWSPIALAVLTWLAVLWLLTSPQRPVELVLFSRARTEPLNVPSQSKLSASRGTACPTPTHELVDLGQTVDGVIDSLDAAHPWERAGAAERELARRAVVAARDVSSSVSRPADASRGRPPPFPRWLVESLEISIVLREIATHHVSRVHVAPGATLGPSGWRILGDILHERGIELCLIDPPSDPSSDGLTIRRLAYATLSREQRTVTAWAVVDGNTPPDDRGRTLQLRFRAGDLSMELGITIPHDVERSRLVQLCFGNCPMGASSAAFDFALRNLDHDVLLSAQDGNATTRVFDDRLLTQRPLLHFLDRVDDILYREAFDAGTVFPDELKGLRAELEASRVPLPTTDEKRAQDRHVYLREQGNLIIVASTAAAARRTIETQPGASSQASGRRTRVTRDDLGRRTLYSFTSISPPQQTTASAHLSTSSGLVESGVTTAPIFGAAATRTPVASIAQFAVHADERIVVIDPGAATAAWRVNPFWAMPTLRAIAYAADIVSRETREDLVTSDDLGAGINPAPLVTESELANSFRESRRPWDLACVVTIGVYVLVMWRRRHSR